MYCPVCRFKQLKLYQISLTSAVYLCPDEKCSYPENNICEEVRRTFEELCEETSTKHEQDNKYSWFNRKFGKFSQEETTGTKTDTPKEHLSKSKPKKLPNETILDISSATPNIITTNNKISDNCSSFINDDTTDCEMNKELDCVANNISDINNTNLEDMSFLFDDQGLVTNLNNSEFDLSLLDEIQTSIVNDYEKATTTSVKNTNTISVKNNNTIVKNNTTNSLVVNKSGEKMSAIETNVSKIDLNNKTPEVIPNNYGNRTIKVISNTVINSIVLEKNATIDKSDVSFDFNFTEW